MNSNRSVTLGQEFEAHLTAVSGVPGWHVMPNRSFPPGIQKNDGLVSGVFVRYDNVVVLDDEHAIFGEMVMDCDRGSQWKRYHYPVFYSAFTGWSFGPPTARFWEDHHFHSGNRPPIRPLFGRVSPETF